jgi:hypothetical protein
VPDSPLLPATKHGRDRVIIDKIRHRPCPNLHFHRLPRLNCGVFTYGVLLSDFYCGAKHSFEERHRANYPNYFKSATYSSMVGMASVHRLRTPTACPTTKCLM